MASLADYQQKTEKQHILENPDTYTGSVENDQDIINAIDIAWSQIEVKEVINELSIADNKINSMQYASIIYIISISRSLSQ